MPVETSLRGREFHLILTALSATLIRPSVSAGLPLTKTFPRHNKSGSKARTIQKARIGKAWTNRARVRLNRAVQNVCREENEKNFQRGDWSYHCYLRGCCKCCCCCYCIRCSNAVSMVVDVIGVFRDTSKVTFYTSLQFRHYYRYLWNLFRELRGSAQVHYTSSEWRFTYR